MNERWYLDVISGAQHGLPAGVVRSGLSALTPFYRVGVAARNGLFDSGLKQSQQVEVPVVSIGNITTGGTGKTPLVAWLAKWLSAHGRRPCFISRGYRSLDGQPNDEFRVLSQLCPDVPHLQDRDRVAAARAAVEQHRPDVLVLDDGFQHRRLRRDLDIVLIDALKPWGYGRLLPRGLLREPKSSLSRADAVLITRADQVDEATRLRYHDEIAKLTQSPIAEVAFRPQRLLGFDGSAAELSALAGQSLLGFCGIGNPGGFDRTLRDAGLTNVPVIAFADHHHYTEGDLRRLIEMAAVQQAAALVTTHKDLVKLDPQWLQELPVWAVAIGAEVIAGADELEDLLNSLFPETAAGDGE